jgi:hypothetical protein
VCLINNNYQNKANEKHHSENMQLINYKIDELTKQVNKHNEVIERTYKLEKHEVIIDEKLKVINHRIDDLENDCKGG